MQDKKRWTRDQKIAVAKICAYVFVGLAGIVVTAIIKLAPTHDQTALLAVRPTAFIPYSPDSPEVPGQRKAQMVAELKLLEKRLANNIHVIFDIDDGAGRRVRSDEWSVVSDRFQNKFSWFVSESVCSNGARSVRS
ncbi:MAG: hypothetical protein HY205_01055 [Nitrospirae bacterium]|nr:hypothetical protein [Nitrospirota bacterium]